MALGIACAGTGLKEAIALLDPMTNDPVNFVRQGALIASAMILIQQTEATCPRVKDFRALYAKVVVDKHEDVMAKFGAILAQGIIDAGKRTTDREHWEKILQLHVIAKDAVETTKDAIRDVQISTLVVQLKDRLVQQFLVWYYKNSFEALLRNL